MAEAVDQIITQMTLVDWLDDLTVRFLLNLPPAELSSVPRLCFQVEEAQWFYEDFIRPANPSLPSLNLRQFCLTLFQHCPLLSGFNSAQHLAAYEEFLAYKVRVPVRGAILMDDNMEKVLLVRGWKKGASWSFPRGKINKDEPDIDCAIREVYEETGFDLGAAGLVERNMIGDGKVKAIDVTMREQHMKLFVFRGVALDTHFETKTRKEIGKIEWYNVRDLPGFKKAKGVAGHGQGEAESVKFYMVAPFLGHLKKWIGEQRRKDSREGTRVQHGRHISLSNEGVQATITEDEAEDTERGVTTDHGAPSVDRSADELKRLLSIGGPAVMTSHPTPPAQQSNGGQTNSLLAMLQGNIVAPAGTSLPHTPYEQVDPFIPTQEPETPQPQHPRHVSAAAHHSQYSPQTLQQGLQQQQAQRHSSMFNSSFAGQQLNYQQPGVSHHPPHLQQQFFQQQQRQQSVPTGFFHGQVPNAHAGQRPNSSGFQQQLPPHLQSVANQSMHTFTNVPQQQRPLSGQAPPAPIGSEKVAPDANKLPPPILNAHSMKLLDAFKTGPRTSKSGGSSSNGSGQRPGSQHQATLLDLFRRPSTTTVSPLSPASAQKEASAAPASPTLTDATEVPVPARKVERRPTLNEITRTLPVKPKSVSPVAPVKSSPVQNTAPVESEQPRQEARAPRTKSARIAPESLQATTPQHDAQAERPKSRGQLYDPSQPKKVVQVKQAENMPSPRSRSRQTDLHQTTKVAAKIPANASPKPRNKQSRNENGQPRPAQQPVPQFSILQRPGSSRAPAPLSPQRSEPPSASNPPQVLKRPTEVHADGLDTRQRQSSVLRTPAADDKKDQLLALFGKSPQSSVAPVPVRAQPAVQRKSPAPAPQPAQQRNALLDLFQGNHAEVTIKTPEPPPSPKLAPERKPSDQGARTQHSQLDLLKLFTKPSASGPSRLNSPGTPISPFTLGTPATNMSMEKLPSAAYDMTPRGSVESRSRLSSMASVMSNGKGRSGSQTPTEHKDMLLGYLNGVVRSEGYKGANKPA